MSKINKFTSKGTMQVQRGLRRKYPGRSKRTVREVTEETVRQ